MRNTEPIPCHLWEPFNHVGHIYRRGDERVNCPGRNRPGQPWVTTKPSRTARRQAVMAAWNKTWETGQKAPDPALMRREMGERQPTPAIQTVIRLLTDWMGPGLMGEICGMQGSAPLKKWLVKPPTAEEEAKLCTGYEAFQIIRREEGVDLARAWMVGMNSLLENHSECRTSDGTPVTEIGLGYGQEVLAAARSYVQDPMVT